MQLYCFTKEVKVQFLPTQSPSSSLLKTAFAHSECLHCHLLLTLTRLVFQQVLSCLCHPFSPLLPGEKGQRTIGYFYVSNAFLCSKAVRHLQTAHLKNLLESKNWPCVCSALHPDRKSDCSCSLGSQQSLHLSQGPWLSPVFAASL